MVYLSYHRDSIIPFYFCLISHHARPKIEEVLFFWVSQQVLVKIVYWLGYSISSTSKSDQVEHATYLANTDQNAKPWMDKESKLHFFAGDSILFIFESKIQLCTSINNGGFSCWRKKSSCSNRDLKWKLKNVVKIETCERFSLKTYLPLHDFFSI